MYRLNITTSDGKVYVSDYVPAKVAPPIDSVDYKIQSSGIQIYLNTHDPNNATHYYHWNYNETWQFHAKYYSNYVSNGTAIVPRSADQQVYQCWGNDIANDIELGSSAKLSQDVIYQAPLAFIPSTSEKIETRYSILVTQYAMTTDGYNYYNLLKENTEELGSIFDAQPSTLTGNIHCTSNPAVPVVGYVTAGTYAQKRIYIDDSQLPNSYRAVYPYDCEIDSDYNYGDLIPIPNAKVPIEAIYGKIGPLEGYSTTDHECADCTIRGTTVEPSFWVDGPNDN